MVSFNKTGYKPDTITIAANTSTVTAITAKLTKSSAFTMLLTGRASLIGYITATRRLKTAQSK